MRRTTPLVLAAVLALAACSDDDPMASNDSVVLGVDAAEGSAATTSASAATSTPAGTTDTTTAATATAASGDSGALVVPLELDECLVGTWTVSLETISSLIAAAVLPVPDLTVPTGDFTVTLNDDGTVLGDADFTGAFTLGDTPSEADVRWTSAGSWGTADGAVMLSLDEQEGGLTEVRIGGNAQPGSALDADLPISGGPYTCTPDRLEVSASTSSTTIPLIFER